MWALPLGRRRDSAAGHASSTRAVPRVRHALLLVLAVLLTLTRPTLGQRRAKARACKVVIRPTTSPPPNGTGLQLAEVRLYKSQGVVIDRSQLDFSLSSAATLDGGVTQDASFCNDGDTSTVIFLPGSNTVNTGPGQICHSKGAPDDPSPSLTVAYPCTTRLFKVVVSNRQDCCGHKIDDFSLDVVGKTGAVTQTYVFTGGSARRTFTIPTACRPGVNTNFSDCSRCLPGRGGTRCRVCRGKDKWSPGGSLEPCRKCPTEAPIAAADKSSCLCSTPGLEFTGFSCVPPCPGSSTRDPLTGKCECTPGVQDTKDCNQCMPGHGGPTCQPCGAGEWSPGGSQEACRECPAVAPTASADGSSCVCAYPGFKFTGTDCVEPCTGVGTYNPLTGDCGACRVVIRPTAHPLPAPEGTELHLAEVQLLRASGSPIDRSLLTFALSSTATWQGVYRSAGFCNDGVSASGVCRSQPAPSDPSPTLTIFYPCLAGLSKVVVTNNQECCGDKINAFSLYFMESNGNVTSTYAFTSGKDTPSYTIPAVCAPGEGGLGCTPCALGFYSAGGNASVTKPSCTQCPPGTNTSAVGATSGAACQVTPCAPGRAGDLCPRCAFGTYSAGGHPNTTTSCSRCPAGTTTTATGAASVDECVGGCKVVIRPTAGTVPVGTVLNLAEVQLFDEAGAQVNRSQLFFALTSTALLEGVPLSADYCNDGDTSTTINGANGVITLQICQSNPAPMDGRPRLSIFYPCAAGLSKVVVHNRQSDCCSSRIDAFSLDILASSGAVTQTYAFTGGSNTAAYTIVTPCAPGRGGDGCPICPVGTFSPGGDPATTPCSPCPTGTNTSTTGAISCKVCNAGRGGPSCTQCALGLYSPGGNATVPQPDCTACPLGTSTVALGATSSSACQVCTPGWGGPSCTQCALDFYSPGGNANATKPGCTACPPGTNTMAPGANSSSACQGNGTCQAVIRPTASPPPNQIIFGALEVQLFGPAGVQMNQSLLNFSLSSTGEFPEQGIFPAVSLKADFCNDGATVSLPLLGNGQWNTGPGQYCFSEPYIKEGDVVPVLTIDYPCSAGLTTVVVTTPDFDVVYAKMIEVFSLDVVASTGAVVKTRAFTSDLSTKARADGLIYTVPIAD